MFIGQFSFLTSCKAIGLRRWIHGGATTTGRDATYPPAICQNWGGGAELGGGSGRGSGGGSGRESGGGPAGGWGGGSYQGLGGGSCQGSEGGLAGGQGGGEGIHLQADFTLSRAINV